MKIMFNLFSSVNFSLSIPFDFLSVKISFSTRKHILSDNICFSNNVRKFFLFVSDFQKKKIPCAGLTVVPHIVVEF